MTLGDLLSRKEPFITPKMEILKMEDKKMHCPEEKGNCFLLRTRELPESKVWWPSHCICRMNIQP